MPAQAMTGSAHDLLGTLRISPSTDEPAYVTLIRLLTFDGRIPFSQSIVSLKPRDHAVFLELIGRSSLRLCPVPDDCAPGSVIVLHSAQGRISFVDADVYEKHSSTTEVGMFVLPVSALERVAEQVAAWEVAENAERAQLDAMLREWEAGNTLAEHVRQVADWVDHVETVMIYIDDEVFSRSDAGTNTLLRGGVLSRLETTPLDHWSRPERLLVAAAHLLFSTGRSIRFEEFNGRQLTATALREWLVTTRQRYAHAAGQTTEPDQAGRPLRSLAAEIRSLIDTVDQSPWIRFRRISGPNFAKSEALAELPRSHRSHTELPPLLRHFAATALHLEPDSACNAEQQLEQLVNQALTLPAHSTRTLLERLLATIVRSAAIDLHADYAMSSAIRDMSGLAPDLANRVSTMLELRKPNFFCCVIPHPHHFADTSDVDLGRMLWLVAQRMQYNRWHFVPGNFDRAEIPAQRHYFFPPLMPDLAEFSELWHGGHIAAQVRFSVRAPGAQLWRAPLSLRGNDYRGCFDIRAVRMSGQPFEREDLWTAVRYSGLVDALWRTVAAHVNEGDAVPAVTAFDRTWYEQRSWAT